MEHTSFFFSFFFFFWFAFICGPINNPKHTKKIKVLLSVFFLDKHASTQGIAALMCCILASTQYEQAPLRPTVVPLHEKDDDDDAISDNGDEEMRPMIANRHLS